jgi:hypothetical protein
MMPPHRWHTVYTPTNSLCIGGHFLSYFLMADTMIARLVEKATKSNLTNHHYGAVEYSIVCMTYALLYRPASRCQ